VDFQNNLTRSFYSISELHTFGKLYWLSCVSWSWVATWNTIPCYQFRFHVSFVLQYVFLSVFMLIRVGIIHLHNFGITQPVYSSELISFAVHGNWTDWGDWNPCSVTCAGGTQSRSRTCTNPPPRNGGRECSGESEDVQSCNEMPCPSKNFFLAV